jgi:hypothetical protein
MIPDQLLTEATSTGPGESFVVMTSSRALELILPILS